MMTFKLMFKQGYYLFLYLTFVSAAFCLLYYKTVLYYYMTLIMNKRTRAAFHKALYRHASREIDDFDAGFCSKFVGVYANNHFSIKRFDKVIA